MAIAIRNQHSSPLSHWRWEFTFVLKGDQPSYLQSLDILTGPFASPHWYIKKGRFSKGYDFFKRLRNSEIQAARDLYYAWAQLRFEKTLEGQANYVSRFCDLFIVPRIRRATLASFVVMVRLWFGLGKLMASLADQTLQIAQQMCGTNIIAFYSGTIFVQAGSTVTEALGATCGYALVVLVFAFVAVFTVDTFGRRSLLLTTFPFLFLSLLAAGFCFYIDPKSTAHIGLIATLIYVFGAFYAAGEGAVPFIYSSGVSIVTSRNGHVMGCCHNHALGVCSFLDIPTHVRGAWTSGHIWLLCRV